MFFLCTAPARAAEPACRDEAPAAIAAKLHEDPYWRILLHYKPSLFGFTSLVDDPRFFLAPDGKTNPEAELVATIRALFAPQAQGDAAAVCRFPARSAWLRERLHLDPGCLPAATCRSFETFMETVRPASVTLIFPAAHLNSPASMFGHTLLTIETANRSKLLSYAVNYTAVTGETFGPLFAVKGLFGLYPGYFSILPYYTKLQEYRDVDHRDIWEYSLNLTAPEIRRMMLHIREMDAVASDYYFFDENCSYDLLFLLEAARPASDLTDRVHGWLIPLDSIRMIEEEGFVTDVRYRPSRTTTIRHLRAQVSEDSEGIALALAGGTAGMDPWSGRHISLQEKIATLDLAGEYLQYLYARKALPQETYRERFLKILGERSRLGGAADETAHPIPPPVPPDRGHHSNRLAVGGGVKKDRGFAEIRIRPAYHHLMDSDAGYVEGAQLIFLDAAFRSYPGEDEFTLEGLDVIDIVSLSPRDAFFHPVSWKIRTGLTRIIGEDGDDHLVYEINPGGGFAYRNELLGLCYAMVETQAMASGALEDHYAVGVGGSAGFIRNVTAFWKVHGFVRALAYGFRDRFQAVEATLQQNFAIGSDHGIGLDITRRKTHGFYETEATVLWNLFF